VISLSHHPSDPETASGEVIMANRSLPSNR
jgi:hypothetical protein